MRHIVILPCEGEVLLATIDGPPQARLGWIFVTGGRQTRVGPHRLYERLARRLAEGGQAVIRFDRRGVGDSTGKDGGYRSSDAEIEAAQAALRARYPLLDQMFGFGLCDGATALALHGGNVKFAGLAMANPWVIEPSDDLPPAAAIKHYYAKRLLDLRAWKRLIGGGVNMTKLRRGIVRTAFRDNDTLVKRVATGASNPIVILAEGDGTAQAFASSWKGQTKSAQIITVPTSSHSFADRPSFERLSEALIDYSAAIASASKSDSAK